MRLGLANLRCSKRQSGYSVYCCSCLGPPWTVICLARTFLYLTLALCTSVQDLDCWKTAALKIIASLEQSYHQPSSILILKTECFSLYISNTQRKKTSKKEKKFVCLSTLIGQCLICVDRYVHEDLTFLSSPLCSIRGYLS